MENEMLTIGTRVTFANLGRQLAGTVERIGEHGGIVFVRCDTGRLRWLHRDSLTVAGLSA